MHFAGLLGRCGLLLDAQLVSYRIRLVKLELDRSIKISSRLSRFRFVGRISTVPSKYPVGSALSVGTRPFHQNIQSVVAVVQNAMFLENIPVLSLVLSPTGAVGWLSRKQLIQFPVR